MNKRKYEIIIDNITKEKFYKVAGQEDILTEKEFKKFYKNAGTDSIDYYRELNLLKDKVLERINKINEVLNHTEMRLNSTDKNTAEYQKLEQASKKYEEDKKYYSDILETIKDKITDFQALQSRVTLEREIDLSQLYSELGINFEEFNDKFNENDEVELIPTENTNNQER